MHRYGVSTSNSKADMRARQSWLWLTTFFLVSSTLSACGTDAPSMPSPEPSLESSEAPLLGTVTCLLGTTTISFSPPLTNTPQDTTVSGVGGLTNCISLLTSPVTSGTTNFPAVLRPGLACDDLLGIRGATVNIVWNTGETSQLSLTQVIISGGSTVKETAQIGTVVSGKYAGATAVRTLTFVTADLENACASPEGLPQYTALQTLALTLIP
ncbi:hypothetical protein FJV41_08385 [Myxococcus llanfairpwllgwyngyllgogerychwyrndrobwllllantysiliogogogochensis]|uniref:Uncharacterized protein n=2 Tax=Myxococcus llanfairpwllgwyngyllgogerychwyrndrobwllllantysiliogogogochensis TaxID=2590453 RepID=A0A540X5F3_9BACT|nr:hypothetical protein FJV41_08385 [Myxococcus llanfairpwllgwyngyllgogerychwyrndrobwllllantysiliogogogochensis]